MKTFYLIMSRTKPKNIPFNRQPGIKKEVYNKLPPELKQRTQHFMFKNKNAAKQKQIKLNIMRPAMIDQQQVIQRIKANMRNVHDKRIKLLENYEKDPIDFMAVKMHLYEKRYHDEIRILTQELKAEERLLNNMKKDFNSTFQSMV